MITSVIPPLDIGLSEETWNILLPPPKVNSFEWICENVRLPPHNAPFDPDAYPWTRGICEAWDDPRIRIIWLMFAARVGKTAIAQSLITCAVSNAPHDALYGTSTQELAKQTIRQKYIPMLRESETTRRWMPPPHKILQTRLELKLFTLYVAWSGSVTTLADIGPKYKHAGEIDKWDRSESDEADPLDLFGERGIEHRDRKSIYESTPAIKGRSRVDTGVNRGSNCRLYVPCRKCGHFQQLVSGDNDPTKGGLVYDQPSDGSPDEQMASETARYVCEDCQSEHGDEHKAGMVSRCVWAPRGQRPDKQGRLEGEASYRGDEASFQLSRLYSRSFTWGELAKEHVAAKHDPSKAQNFRNSVEGLPYELHTLREQWQDVAKRLCGDHELGDVPDDCVFVTRGMDIQIDHMVHWACAWTPGVGAYCIDYGIVFDWSEVLKVINSTYGSGTAAVVTLMDVRFRGSEVMDFCTRNSKRGRWILPCAGSSGDIPGKMYRTTPIDLQTKRPNASTTQRIADIEHVTVNTPMTQNWVHWCISDRMPGQRNSLCMPASAKDDKDFFEQILNEQPDQTFGRTKYGPVRWIVINENIPVDFRDTVRYARAAAEWYTRGKWARVQKRSTRRTDPGNPPPPKKEVAKPAPVTETAEPERRTPWVRRMNRRR